MSSYYHVIFILYIALFSKLYIIFLYVFYNLISFLLFFSFFAIVILTIAQNFQIWQMVCSESIFKDIFMTCPKFRYDRMKWYHLFRFRCGGMKRCTFSDAYDRIESSHRAIILCLIFIIIFSLNRNFSVDDKKEYIFITYERISV